MQEAEALLPEAPSKALPVTSTQKKSCEPIKEEQVLESSPPSVTPPSPARLFNGLGLTPTEPPGPKGSGVKKPPVRSKTPKTSKSNPPSSKTSGPVLKKSPANPMEKAPRDSPYSDIDSVPRILCPKPQKTSELDLQPTPLPPGKEERRKGFGVGGDGEGNGLAVSGAELESFDGPLTGGGATAETTDTLVSKDLHDTSRKAVEVHSACLPASSRLMTRALRSQEQADQRDRVLRSRTRSRNSSPLPPAPEEAADDSAPTEALPGASKPSQSTASPEPVPETTSPTSPCAPSPSLLLKCADTKAHGSHVPNGLLIKPEDEGGWGPACMKRENGVPAVQVKRENAVSDASSYCSSSPPLSPMEAFQDLKEITFRSLQNEEGGKPGKPVTFRPDGNYKFSTFLMLLKDAHDSRERRGTPLVPETGSRGPTRALMKEEPSLIPSSSPATDLAASQRPGFWAAANSKKVPALKNLQPKPKRVRHRPRPAPKKKVSKYEGDPVFSPSKYSRPKRPRPSEPGRGGVGGAVPAELAEHAYGRGGADGGLGDPSFGGLLDGGHDGGVQGRVVGVAPKKRWLEQGGIEMEGRGGALESHSVVPSEQGGAFGTSQSTMEAGEQFLLQIAGGDTLGKTGF